MEETNTTAEEESVKCDKNLPVRLFATDRFPVARLNIYSKVGIISAVHEKLKGTPEFEKLRNSWFGKLFEFPVNRCPISSKLIHALLVRQLVTKKKYEWWTVFGGQPLRFSLSEFGFITGLNCSEFPEDYSAAENIRGREENLFWNKLIGEDTDATLGDIAALFEKSGDDMPSWRKLGLALILIVDGVLIARHQIGRPTPRYVEMVKDIDSFLDFPWGRESFLATLSAIRPRKKILTKRDSEDSVGQFRQQLQQQTFSVQGFPLVLQLLAFRSISSLVERIPNARDSRTLMDVDSVGLGKVTLLTVKDVRDVEHDSNLVVVPVIDEEHAEEDWDDEVKDKKVAYMEKLIKSGHIFEKSHWPGGDDSLDMYVHKPKIANGKHRKHVLERRSSTGKKNVQMKVSGKKMKRRGSSDRKQQKVDYYFRVEGCEPEVDRDSLVAEVSELRDAIKRLSDRVAVLERKIGGNERTKTRDVVMQEVGNDGPSPGRKYIDIPSEDEEGLDDGRVDILSLSDSSSSPIKRRKYNTSEEERKLATMLVSNEKKETLYLLPAPDDTVFKLFRETLELDKQRQYVTPCNFLIDHKFLLDLAKPKNLVTTLHMEVLVSFLGARHEKVLAAERSCFVAPWFINHLQGKYQNFRAAANKSRVMWGDEVKQFVCKPGMVWFEDIDTIYVPMIWEDEHWVGVVINLKLWSCEVLDPLKTKDRKMKKYMALVVEQLPYIVQQFCKPEASESRGGLKPFGCNMCEEDTYENKRGGDCGPVAMKFLELHANGDLSGMADIDDGVVDDLRKQYAMDLYAELVAPLVLA